MLKPGEIIEVTIVKEYVVEPAVPISSCEGCVAQNDAKLCDQLPYCANVIFVEKK